MTDHCMIDAVRKLHSIPLSPREIYCYNLQECQQEPVRKVSSGGVFTVAQM